jgi:hypothetical protein
MPDRPREQAVEDEELGDVPGTAGHAARAGEGLVSAAGLQQHLRPELILRSRHPGQQHPGRHVHPLYVLAQYQEPPGVVVAHGRVGQAEEQCRSLPDESQVAVRAQALGRLALTRQAERGHVQALPHLAGDHLAHGARAGSRRQRGASDGARALRVVGELIQGDADVQPGGLRRRDAEHGEQCAAPRMLIRLRFLQHAMHVDIDHPGGVVGALDVAAGPEHGLGDAAEQPGAHGAAAASGPVHCGSLDAGPPCRPMTASCLARDASAICC